MDLTTWGLGFVQGMEDRPGDSTELLAAMAVCSVVRECLLHGSIDRRSIWRAGRILAPIQDLGLRTWASQTMRLCRPGQGWPSSVVAALRKLARSFEKRGMYRPAIDVSSVIADSEFVDPTTRLYAMRRIAFCYRSANLVDDAEFRYDFLGERARAWGSVYYEFAAQQGLASVAVQRGRFAAAEEMLCDLREAAERCGEGKMLVEVLISLSEVAGKRLCHDRALDYGLRAARLATDPIDLHCAVHNIAEACERMGGRETAAKIADWLVTSAPRERERIEGEDLRDRLKEATLEPITPADALSLVPLRAALADAAGIAQ